MRKILFLITILMIFSVCAQAAESRKAVISFLKGSARITKKSEKDAVPAKLSMELSEGDKIETDAETKAELKMEDGSTVRISENTAMVLEEMTGDRDTGKDKSTMKVIFGRVWMNVKKSLGQESRIVTPKVIAAVKGTSYGVEVGKDGESKVNVYDGKVACSNGSNEVLLSKLESLTTKDLMRNQFDEQSDERDSWVRWNKSRDKLRIMIVAKEIKNKEPALVPISEAIMNEEFMKNYLFTVIDQSQLNEIRNNERLKAALKGDTAAAAAAGLEFNSDVIIILDVTTGVMQLDKEYGGLFSATTNISGKVVRTDDAIMLSSKVVKQAFPGNNEDSAASEAIGKAAKSLSGIFMDDIVKKWKEENRNGGNFTITCTNLTDYEKAKALEKALSGVEGAKDVTQYNYTAKAALYELQYQGGSKDLAEKLSGLSIGTAKIDVVGLTAYRVELEAK